MKKVFLFLFLLVSVIVSAGNWVFSNSLSPPGSLDVKIVPQQMLQPATCEIRQLDAVLFECDVSLVNLENPLFFTSASADKIDVVSFQIIAKINDASTTGKSDVILEAISPQCRTVVTSDFSQIVWNNSSGCLSEVDPQCRTVSQSTITQFDFSPVIAAISPKCRDVSLVA
jgi:hypothetical protein